MFTCIACTKQVTEDDGGDDSGGSSSRGSGAPGTKDAVKNLTTQIKDMALKISGGGKQSGRPVGVGSGSYKRDDPFATTSEGIRYKYGGGSSSSTPAWDFPSGPGRHQRPGREESRFAGDRTPGGVSVSASDVVVLDEQDEPKEWMAQVEPGVNITFVSLPDGGNDLKRIRFSRDMFDKWQAQRWWTENYDGIMELYDVRRLNRQALDTPSRFPDEMRDSSYTRLESARESPVVHSGAPARGWPPRPPGNKGPDQGGSSQCGATDRRGEATAAQMDPSRMTTSSRDEASVSYSNASEVEAEWTQQDEPGVHITIRQLVNGTRELRRVRFSREKFEASRAKQWWEENRDRIQSTYL